MVTVGDVLRSMRLALTEAGIDSARHEAALLISIRADLTLAQIYSHPERTIAPAQVDQLRSDLKRRLGHEPIAYILGETEFYGLTFSVGPGVLIPRADTERLVEIALEQIDASFPEDQPVRILDTCTGSGCAGISVAWHLKEKGRPFQLDLVDLSPGAIAYARENVQQHQLETVIHIFEADLWPASDPYDVILANPPYVVQSEVSELMPDVSQYEPWNALDGGTDGLDFYRRLTNEASGRLNRPGLLLVEHGFDQALAVEDLFRQAGYENRITVCDYGGHPRVTGGWL